MTLPDVSSNVHSNVVSIISVLPSISFTTRLDHPDLHSFPTRRSSDLSVFVMAHLEATESETKEPQLTRIENRRRVTVPNRTDRKSTRLNSSHLVISYAVFCLKKKMKIQQTILNI